MSLASLITRAKNELIFLQGITKKALFYKNESFLQDDLIYHNDFYYHKMC